MVGLLPSCARSQRLDARLCDNSCVARFAMLESLFGMFSCRHRRTTRPITPLSKPGSPAGETYVVCLDCGKHFAYDWTRMRLGAQIDIEGESPDPKRRY
jgi:hypothetical protein